MGNASANKVAVIGLDGADWDYIKPLMDNGEMPNLAEIVEEGGSGNLTSSNPVMSPVAWTSYSTGSDPSVHGIYDFMQRMDGEFRPTTANNIKQPYFWNQLPEGKRAVVVNVPMTYPPSETNGVLVSGYLASNDTTYTHPSSLTEELNSKDYIIESLAGGYDKEREDEILEHTNKTAEKRTEVAMDLYREEKPEFFQVTYTGLDRVQHYFALESSQGDSSGVKNHYRKLDAEIGKVKQGLDENTTIIVMSDHGFQPLETEIYLNHWMKQQGYLETKGSESLLGKLGITQQRVAPILRQLGVMGLAQDIMALVGFNPDTSVPQPTMNDIDLDNTKAYAGNYRGGIYIVEENVENPEEFKQQLIQELKGLEIDGEDPFDSVQDADEVYSQTTEDGPSILVSTGKGFHVVGFLGEGRLYSNNPEKKGIHALNGIIATNADNLDVSNPDITDVAPTVLELLDAEKPDHMTGNSVVE